MTPSPPVADPLADTDPGHTLTEEDHERLDDWIRETTDTVARIGAAVRETRATTQRALRAVTSPAGHVR